VILTFANALPQNWLGLMTPLLLSGQRSCRFRPQRSGWVHGPQTRPALPRLEWGARNAGPAHNWLPGPNGPTIYRLTRGRRGASRRRGTRTSLL
jgi:hypothetical protein